MDDLFKDWGLLFLFDKVDDHELVSIMTVHLHSKEDEWHDNIERDDIEKLLGQKLTSDWSRCLDQVKERKLQTESELKIMSPRHWTT